MKIKNKKQRGVSAIEFAMVFPVLFLMLYGLLTYSLIFAVKHSLALAAAEGARAAVRFQTVSSDTAAQRKAAACQIAKNSIDWITSIAGAASCNGSSVINIDVETYNGACGIPPANTQGVQCIRVSARYSYNVLPIIPILPLILPVPAVLESKSSTQIALMN